MTSFSINGASFESIPFTAAIYTATLHTHCNSSVFAYGKARQNLKLKCTHSAVDDEHVIMPLCTGVEPWKWHAFKRSLQYAQPERCHGAQGKGACCCLRWSSISEKVNCAWVGECVRASVSRLLYNTLFNIVLIIMYNISSNYIFT